MRLRLFTSLITATTILTSVLPAYAEPGPWISRDVLATDHQAYCNDIIGQDIQRNQGSYAQNDIGSWSNSSNRSQMASRNSTKKKGGGGGIGFGPIQLGGSGQSSRSEASRSAEESRRSSNSSWDRSSQYSYDRSTVTSVAVGKDCDGFNRSAAQVETTLINAETNRMAIEAKERVRLQEIETNAQTEMFNTLMQDW